MSSIIDDIHSVESIIEKIKAAGRREIQQIYENQAKKITEMQDYFADNFSQEVARLEESVRTRTAEYEEILKNSYPDASDALQRALDTQKDKIIAAIIQEFWRK